MEIKELSNTAPCPFCGSIPFGSKDQLGGKFEIECCSEKCCANPKIFADAPITDGLDKGTIMLDFIEAQEIATNKWNEAIKLQQRVIRKECYEIFLSHYKNMDAFGYIRKQILNE